MVTPKDSEWFGTYKENDTTSVVDMKDTDFYKNVRLL